MVEKQLVYKDMQQFLKKKKATKELVQKFDVKQNYEILLIKSKEYGYVYESKNSKKPTRVCKNKK